MTDTTTRSAGSGYARPEQRLLPTLTAESHAYWTGGAKGTLLISHCHACGRFFHPPGPVCWRCRSTDVAPEPVSGRGRVGSFTINRQPWVPTLPPPYVVAMIELDDEPDVRVISNVVDVAPEDVAIGMEVEVFFEEWIPQGAPESEPVWVPLFRPVTGGAR